VISVTGFNRFQYDYDCRRGPSATGAFQRTANSDYVCWQFSSSRHVSSRNTLGLAQLYGLVILSLYIYILPCSLFFVCSLPNEQKKKKKIGHECMARPRIEPGIPAQPSQEIHKLMVAGADHLPPNRFCLYFQSK
jgi:hypothetical protein